jgi:hypothetical protein
MTFDIVGVLFTVIFAIIGWFWGRYLHKYVLADDSVYLPPFLALFFGNVKPFGVYNIRGIYFQLFSFWLLFPFIAYNLKLISLENSVWTFIAGLFIFPVLEIIRYLKKKS